MLCLGCGTDLPCTEDRRALDNLDNSDCRNVVKVWKSFVLDSAIGVDLTTVNDILNGSDKRRVPKMCRKCFLAYKKYSNTYDVLQDNLQKAVAALDLIQASSSTTPPLPKKPRVHMSLPSTGSSSKSPDVVVCLK